MKLIVDPEKCIGCNMCEDISQGAMSTKYGKDEKAAINPEADLTDRVIVANLKMAAETCPMQAISIEE
jgi:ferredoxin